MNEHYRRRGSARIPQKKNPFNKVEGWRKPWEAATHAYKGVQIFRY